MARLWNGNEEKMGRLVLFAIVFAIFAVFLASFLNRNKNNDDDQDGSGDSGDDNVRRLSDHRSNDE